MPIGDWGWFVPTPDDMRTRLCIPQPFASRQGACVIHDGLFSLPRLPAFRHIAVTVGTVRMTTLTDRRHSCIGAHAGTCFPSTVQSLVRQNRLNFDKNSWFCEMEKRELIKQLREAMDGYFNSKPRTLLKRKKGKK